MSSEYMAGDIERLKYRLGTGLITRGKTVTTKRWQAMDVTDRPTMTPIELQNVTIDTMMPDTLLGMQQKVQPNLPWAEDHFLERVSGEPLNPPPSHEWWPYARRGNAEHIDDEQFSHTYPERFWPKYAGSGIWRRGVDLNRGIRFEYGDLQDVATMLLKDNYTRQAYLPVFFPEDTGATADQRIPCTLGYTFQIRPDDDVDRMHITYHIRSCDFLRHFSDDVYMAMRLAKWMIEAQLQGRPRRLMMGDLVMHMDSLHVFEGDRKMMENKYATK